MKKTMKKLLAAFLSVLLMLTLVPGVVWADEDDDIQLPELPFRSPEYGMEMILDKDGDYRIGDTVTLTVRVTCDGEEVSDLAEAGLYLFFWKDVWSGDYASEGYNLDNDANSGRSLSASVTFADSGEYCVGYNLQDSSYNTLIDTNYVQFSVTDGVEPVIGEIEVERVPTLTDDFIMGMDISSAPSLFDAGVTFSGWNEDDLFYDLDSFVQFLADCGITHVRVRIWNDPYDEDGRSYGGGNCDIDNAVEIARACANAGVHMLIDFHYSDFWADPGRQTAPKEWDGIGFGQKVSELDSFTYDSLTQIAGTGARVDMVQIGNETTTGIAGETDEDIMCLLFQAGTSAVREFARDWYDDENAIKTVIHVTNPEQGNMDKWARILNSNRVDYDVLATSYYPYWHGNLENLQFQMDIVKNYYGKDVMVSETSYTYTLEDTDGWENTIRDEASKGEDAIYPSSVQGQATAIRNVINAVSEVGGLGVFYWEPAWITVGDITGLDGDALADQIASNAELWEEYGCGWASKAAASYDANVGPDGEYAGGSPIDNEAMFNPFGEPLESLHVWEYVRTGSETAALAVEEVEAPEIVVDYAEDLENAVLNALPDYVNVTYSKAKVGTIEEQVFWSDDDIEAITGIGTFEVAGTVMLSQDLEDGTTEVDTVCTVHVKEANILADEGVYGFESAGGFTVDGSGVELPSAQDVLAGSASLHWYSKTAVTDTVTTNEATALDAGWYTLECKAMGFANDTVALRVLNEDGGILAEGEPVSLTGWTQNPSEYLDSKVAFEIKEPTNVLLQVELGVQDGGWGSVDSLYLHKHQHVGEEETSGNDVIQVTYTCDDCGEELGTLEKEAPAIVVESVTVVFQGKIRIRFTASIPDEILEDDGAHALLIQGAKQTQQGFDKLEFIGEGRYYVYYPVPIPEFGDQVVLRFFDGGGAPIKTMSSAGTDYTESGVVYSVKTYADRMIQNSENPNMVALAHALRNYGIAAQNYFEYQSEFTEVMEVDQDVLAVSLDDLEDYTLSTKGTRPAGVKGASISVNFQSDNTLRIKFSFEDGYEASQFTYKVDGKKKTSSNGTLMVKNVAAPNLGKAHTFSISDGKDTYTIKNASVLSYARTSIINGNENRKTLGRAIYLYYKAADAYFNQGD